MTTVFSSAPKITNKQLDFIRDLAAKREWREALKAEHSITVKMVLRYDPTVDTELDVPRKLASATITALLNCASLPQVTQSPQTPQVQVSTQSPWEQLQTALQVVPPARYAIQGEDGIWRFFHVVRRKTGALFVNRLLGGPGAWQSTFVGITQQLTIAQAIAVDPLTAAIAFSQQHGVCSVCGSPLSNPKSIEESMGPVCRKKF